ncbi:MAG: Ig domain-containing protein, partial [Oscillibacter sp.]|nr:Ig domain-containing protein [Oscillibacter sp.]
WKSDDPSVATVDAGSGRIRAIGEGSTSITATCRNCKKKCTVNVTIPYKPVRSVQLSEHKLDMEIGGKVELTATIDPPDATKRDLYWVVSDDSVVTVENGWITAKHEGEARITVSCDGEEDTCNVTVIPPYVPVDSITLNEDWLYMGEKDVLTLIATVTPHDATNQNLTWRVNDESIITVNQRGEVEAKQVGEAWVSVSCDGKKDSCNIHVIKPVESIRVTRYYSEIYVGDTVGFMIETYPENATEVSFGARSSNNNAVTIEGYNAITHAWIITGNRAGSTVITFTCSNSMPFYAHGRSFEASTTCELTVLERPTS